MKQSGILLTATALIAILLIAVGGGAFLVFAAHQALGAKNDFCWEMDRALACHDSKKACLVAYHQTVTEKLSRAKTTMEFNDNLFILDNLDSFYQDGKDLLASDLRETAPEDFEKQRADLVYDCSSYP